MLFNSKKRGDKPIQLGRFKNKFNARFKEYRESVFLNPEMASWDRTDLADVHSRLFKFLLSEKSISYELSICEFSSTQE